MKTLATVQTSIQQKGGVGNTRPNLHSQLYIHLDYLRTIHKLPVEDFELLLLFVDHKYIGVRPEIPWTVGKGGTWYENTITSPEGISGGFTIDNETNTVEVMLDFSGQYFSGKSAIDQWRLLVGLKHRFDADCSRIDIAMDDDSFSQIPLTEMVEAADRGDNFRFKSRGIAGKGKCGKDMTLTHYFGSRESGKYVRIYNHKNLTHRFEVEYKRAYSRKVFNILSTVERRFADCIHAIANQPEVSAEEMINQFGSDCMDAIANWFQLINEKDICDNKDIFKNSPSGEGEGFERVLQTLMGSIAVSAIDFRNKSEYEGTASIGYRHTTRLPFYQRFIDLIGQEIRIKPPKKESKIQNTAQWMARQVSKTFYMFTKALGAMGALEFMSAMKKLGESKMTLADEKLVQYMRDNPELLRI